MSTASNTTNTVGPLGQDLLDGIIKAHNQLKERRIAVGFAVSPHTMSLLQHSNKMPDAIHRGIVSMACPIIVDPRLTLETSEVYFDEMAWKARCLDQRIWDAQRTKAA